MEGEGGEELGGDFGCRCRGSTGSELQEGLSVDLSISGCASVD